MTASELQRNAHVLVLQEMRDRFTEAGIPSRTAALDAAIAALAARQPVGHEPSRLASHTVDGELSVASAIDQVLELFPSSGRAALQTLAGLFTHPTIYRYATPPAQSVDMSPEFTDTARAAIAWVLWHHLGGSSPVGQPLRFALGMGQHDRMTDHQVAEAKRFAAWAGATSEGFHSRAPAQAVGLVPLAMETAPRDGTMIHLLVQFEENATEDTAEPAWTIGACNDDNVGDDERVGWQFAGWCWTHDHFTEGKGTPVGWLPMIDSNVSAGEPNCAPNRLTDTAKVNLFYIQDTRQFVGNCPMWWGPNGSGYVTRLDEAGRYTEQEAIRQNRTRETDVPWPCSEIDALARQTVDCQHMRPRAERLAELAVIDSQAVGNG